MPATFSRGCADSFRTACATHSGTATGCKRQVLQAQPRIRTSVHVVVKLHNAPLPRHAHIWLQEPATDSHRRTPTRSKNTHTEETCLRLPSHPAWPGWDGNLLRRLEPWGCEASHSRGKHVPHTSPRCPPPAWQKHWLISTVRLSIKDAPWQDRTETKKGLAKWSMTSELVAQRGAFCEDCQAASGSWRIKKRAACPCALAKNVDTVDARYLRVPLSRGDTGSFKTNSCTSNATVLHKKHRCPASGGTGPPHRTQNESCTCSLRCLGLHDTACHASASRVALTWH